MRIAFGNGAEPAKFTYLPVATRLHQHADVARGSGLNSNGFFLKKIHVNMFLAALLTLTSECVMVKNIVLLTDFMV